MMKSKIHRVTVTEANLDYEGSLNEQVHVWDVTNGHRLITYALAGKRGSGIVCVNGAGAHLIKPGDLVIVATYATMKDKDAHRYKPLVVFVDAQNRLKELPKHERD
jgi:aspartate 1-decarboxylase